MKFFIIIHDFVFGESGFAGTPLGFDSLEEAKEYAKLLTSGYTIIKGDIVEKKN